MKKDEKTNVMRVLESKKIPYGFRTYQPDASLSGAEIAALLGEKPEKVFKTLVTQGKSSQYYVFVVPVEAELDLKKAAKAVSEKSIAMIPQKDLLPLTGYVHGGCSPIGMKKRFPTCIHQSADLFDTIHLSAGRVGAQIEISPSDLKKLIGCEAADLIL